MNDHVKALLDAERAVAATADDDAFADRVVGHLRHAAIAGVAAGLATSSPAAAATSASTASATAAATTTAVATTTAASIGVAKLVGIVGVVGCLGAVSVSLVARTPSTPAPDTQATANVPVEWAAPVVEPVDPVEPAAAQVDVAAAVDPTSAERSVAPASPRSRVTTTSMPVPAPAPPAPSSPTELERYDAASAMLRAGRVDEAATLFAALLSTSPQGLLRPETHMSLLESLYRGGRFSAVVDAVPAALLDVDGARVAEVHRLEGDALVKLGRCDEARVAYTAAVAAPSRLTIDDVTAALSACSPR